MSVGSNWAGTRRLGGLRRFAVAISVLNLLGHFVLGFEQSWAQPLVALAAAYGTELAMEAVAAAAERRRPHFAEGVPALVDFLLSAHISGLAVSMLLYANDRLAVVAFAAATAIVSKAVLRAPVGGGRRHFLNPSNFGITLTLLLFPWVGIAPPYQFTENLRGAADWVLPAVIVVSGSFLNARFSQRLPLIAAWMGGFLVQGLLRSAAFGTPPAAALLPMTGVAFLLYSFYMVTDPATTPSGVRGQLVFGASVATTYGFLMTLHVVFGLFFALTFVSVARGLALWAAAWGGARARASAPARLPMFAGKPTP